MSTTPRTRRHRVTILCVGLAAFLATVAVLLPVYTMPKLKKIPLDTEANTLSLATGSVVDADAIARGQRARTESDVPLEIRVFVNVQEPANEDVVTFQAATSMRRTDRPEKASLVTASVDRVTVDRVTGEPQSDPPATAQTEATEPATVLPTVEGFQYKFPFDTQRITYPFYDDIARQTNGIDYVDDNRIEDGLRLYHFQQRIPTVNLRLTQPDQSLTLPAEAWGLPGEDQVTFDLFYTNERHVWVEPISGSIVSVEEHPRRYLARSVDDPLAVTTLDIRTTFAPETLADNIARTKSARTQILWGGTYVPIGLGIAAVISLAIGVGSGAFHRRPTYRGSATEDASVTAETVSG